MIFLKNSLFIFLCFIGLLHAQVVDVYDQQQFEHVTKNGLAVVKFSARWCPPCQQIRPYFIQLSNDSNYKDVAFIEVDIDKIRPLTRSLNIQNIPTFIFFENSKRVKTFTGAHRSPLKKALDDFVLSRKVMKAN